MDPWRPVQRSFYNYWGEGQGYVDIFVHSAPTGVEPHRVDRAHVVLYQQNRSFLVHAPLYVDNEGFLTPPIRESWFEDLQAFGSFEQTVAGQAIAAHIRSVPHLRDFVQEYFIDVIVNEARDAAQNAASLQHRAVWMIVDLNITIHFGYNAVADDDDDGGSYLGEVEAEVVGDAEVDPAASDQGVGADAEVQQLAAPEGVVGDGVRRDIVLEGVVGDPPGDPEDYVDLETLLTRLLGQPVAPFLEAVGMMRRGLSPAAIGYHLTVDTFMGTTSEMCSICLENIVSGTPAGWLPCSHVFHPACIANWLDRNAVCPICRLKLSNNNDIGD
ncbi:hypothetical protein COCNU_scaffold011582G000020 [Cocos nucifera]|nr:hypothetical protein [Cocos nucifera]